jgi:hypothetical protein
MIPRRVSSFVYNVKPNYMVIVKGKGKGKVHPSTDHEGPEGE